MKLFNVLFVAVFLLAITDLSAQMGGGGGYCNPDSLEVVTVSGYTIVDTSHMHPMYYLDEDNNGVADYNLNFGPYWYEPDSSGATRPLNGDYITIKGGLVDSTMMGIQSIIVYEINGLFWRDPYESFWNHMGQHGANCNHNMDSCNINGYGWMHNPPQTVTLSGNAMVDSTFMMVHYYLDENNDGIPDYFLNFGPPWYQPQSGAVRPQNGDQIQIVGGLIENSTYPMVIVYEINGLLWRDSSSFGGHMGGGWIHRYMTQPVQLNTFFDGNDWIQMNPGWYTGGSGMMHDSLFCQIFEVVPGEINNLGNEKAFAGYEVDFFYSMGMGGGMGQGMQCGEHMQFGSNAGFRFHYTDAQLSNIDESSIQVKYWNSNLNSWSVVTGTQIDLAANTISFNSEIVGNDFILTGDSPTSVEPGGGVVTDFQLMQNYPNPFNPLTTITYSIPQNANVSIKVFDILGKEIVTLVNESKPAGTFEVSWNALNLPSGVYMYRIQAVSTGRQAGEFSQTKKMILMK